MYDQRTQSIVKAYCVFVASPPAYAVEQTRYGWECFTDEGCEALQAFENALGGSYIFPWRKAHVQDAEPGIDYADTVRVYNEPYCEGGCCD